MAERIFTLHRALTIRDMKTADMRRAHDTVPSWAVRHCRPTSRPSPRATQRMDRADIERAKDLFYDVLGWDRATGAPTRSSLERLGLRDVAGRLEAMGQLPLEKGRSAADSSQLAAAAPCGTRSCPPPSPLPDTLDAVGAIAEAVRRDSAIYPRPTPVAALCEAPFGLPEADAPAILDRLLADPSCSDIRLVAASDGSRFLYSSRHMSDVLASSRAEWMAVGHPQNP